MNNFKLINKLDNWINGLLVSSIYFEDLTNIAKETSPLNSPTNQFYFENGTPSLVNYIPIDEDGFYIALDDLWNNTKGNKQVINRIRQYIDRLNRHIDPDELQISRETFDEITSHDGHNSLLGMYVFFLRGFILKLHYWVLEREKLLLNEENTLKDKFDIISTRKTNQTSKTMSLTSFLIRPSEEEKIILLSHLKGYFKDKTGKDIAFMLLALEKLSWIYIPSNKEIYDALRNDGFGNIGTDAGINKYYFDIKRNLFNYTPEIEINNKLQIFINTIKCGTQNLN